MMMSIDFLPISQCPQCGHHLSLPIYSDHMGTWYISTSIDIDFIGCMWAIRIFKTHGSSVSGAGAGLIIELIILIMLHLIRHSSHINSANCSQQSVRRLLSLLQTTSQDQDPAFRLMLLLWILSLYNLYWDSPTMALEKSFHSRHYYWTAAK